MVGLIVIAAAVIVLITATVWAAGYGKRIAERQEKRVEFLFRTHHAMSVGRLLELCKSKDFRDKNMPGIYILYNQPLNLYYVGQGQRVFSRAKMHFTGKGNGNIYADYRGGNEFFVTILPLAKSGFTSLNAFERSAIAYFDCHRRGYNRTRGNKD